jgi:hypothetical protein
MGNKNTGLPWQKQQSTWKRLFFTSKLEFNSRKILIQCYILNVPLCDAETWTIQKVDQKYLGSFEMKKYYIKSYMQ